MLDYRYCYIHRLLPYEVFTIALARGVTVLLRPHVRICIYILHINIYSLLVPPRYNDSSQPCQCQGDPHGSNEQVLTKVGILLAHSSTAKVKDGRKAALQGACLEHLGGG